MIAKVADADDINGVFVLRNTKLTFQSYTEDEKKQVCRGTTNSGKMCVDY